VKVVKNKVAPPFKKVELEIIFGKGVSATASLLDAALRFELISKSGSWYSFGEERIGQGRENAKDFLDNNPDIAKDIDLKVRKLLFPERYKEEEGSSPEKSSGKSKSSTQTDSAAQSKANPAQPAQPESAAEKPSPDKELF